MINLTDMRINTGSAFEYVCPYPVGAIYISYTSTSPSSIWGGTWTSVTTGVLRAKASNSTGGADSASHYHSIPLGWDAHNSSINGAAVRLYFSSAASSSGTSGMPYYGSTVLSSSYGENVDITTNHLSWPSGTATTRVANTETLALSRLPAYQNIYCWRRTA